LSSLAVEGEVRVPVPGRHLITLNKHGFALHDDGGLQADGEETFAGTRGNDEDAPKAVVLSPSLGTLK
jgi:hypothetical protein